MCLKGGDFNYTVAVQNSLGSTEGEISYQGGHTGSAKVFPKAFPLVRDDRDDQLVQIADAGDGLGAEPICRGQVSSSDVKDYLTKIMDLCHEVEAALTHSFEAWQAKNQIPNIDEISGDVFSRGISIGPILHCLKGDPPDPIVKNAEVISVRIESRLCALLSRFRFREWFMIRISEIIRKIFGEAKRDDVIVIFYSSIFSLDRSKRRNNLVFVDLNIQNNVITAEKKDLISHLKAFFGPETVSKALQPLNPGPMHKISGTQHQWRFAAAISAAIFLICVIGATCVLVMAIRHDWSPRSQVGLLIPLAVFSIGLLISHSLTLTIDEAYGIEKL